jgi:type IV pilus assembly protein PilM
VFLDRFKSLLDDPPPAMAFEISQEGIAVARMASRAKTEIGFQPLNAGAITVSPLQENVLDPAGFLEAVRALAAAQGARKRKDVALILPDYCARLAVLDFDNFPTDAKEQAALVRFRLKRSVPFDVETAALSYFAQPAVEKHVDVVVATTPLEILSPYEAPFRMVGLNPGLVTVSSLAALDLAPDTGINLMAKLSGNVLSLLVREKARLKLARCLELPSPELDDVAAVLLPTFVYVEDNLGGRAERLILCGFGARTEEAQRRFQEEMGVEVEPVRSPLGTPAETNAGLLGYLRSIARNN